MGDRTIINNIKGFLFDLDGVFYISNRPIAGGADTIQFLRRKNIPFRFITNTTNRSRTSLFNKLSQLNIPAHESEIISAAYAGVLYLKSLGNPISHLILNNDVLRDYQQFPLSDVNPEVVVVGDIGKKWDFNVLNQAFQLIMKGAKLIALHKGRYFQTSEGLRMDVGAYVQALEYATGTEAVVIGKPSSSFFELALKDLGLSPHEVAMAGDDIINDVGGAQKSGLKGILVKSGKYRENLMKKSGIKPDLILDTISELPKLL